MAPPLAGKFLLTLPQSDLSSTSKESKASSPFSSNSSKLQHKHQQQRQRQRPDLVLFQVPSCWDDILAGKCRILANGESASLVSPTSSVQLVTVGTSNSLVVWKQQQQQQQQQQLQQQKGKATETETEAAAAAAEEENTANNEDTATNGTADDRSYSNKRSKTVTPCRLIQPGGSGASFLVVQSNPIRRDELLSFFANSSSSSSTSSSPSSSPSPAKSSVARRYSTETLSNLFQCSDVEMEEALSQIPTVVAFFPPEATINTGISSTTTTITSSACYWQLVPEEEVLYGQKALVQMLVEGDDDGVGDDAMKGEGGNMKSLVEKLDNLTNKVSERLLPILMEHESEQTQQKQQKTDDSSPSSWSSRTERSKAIARKTILLAETKTQKGKTRHPNHCRLSGGGGSGSAGDGGNAVAATTLLRSNIRIDPNTVAFYVLRDLFLEQSSYHASELLTKWSTRLPFGDEYERIIPDDYSSTSTSTTAATATINPVTTEWLKDRNILPSQLTISNRHKDKDAVKTTATNSTSKEVATAVTVIHLTTPGTVLTLKTQ